jgi:Baseplate J-like protein
MKQPCGCCAGIEVVTPETEANRPGLPAMAYRVGTHGTFLESMLARLSTLSINTPDATGKIQRTYPLRSLTTREASDPSIALLDSWAVVADVLSFYQERIANEGYLRSATERRSILELARLIGYRLRPGVSASVYLAFTVADGFYGQLPAGTRAQSIPGTGEKPQFFETSDPLLARDVWNSLKPRLTRPQLITLPGVNSVGGAPTPTGADQVETIYFQGTSTNLNAGDTLFIVLGNAPQQQFLRKIQSVDPQPDEARTEATLLVPVADSASDSVVDAVKALLQPFVDDASGVFSDSELAGEVAQTFTQLMSDVATAGSPTAAAEMVAAVLPQIEDKHALAEKRKFTRLEPWLANALTVLQQLVQRLPNIGDGEGGPPPGSGGILHEPLEVVTSPLRNLVGIVQKLAQPPSLQPANSLRLARTVSTAFSRQSDIAPRILSRFYPAAAKTLYHAWAGIETPALTLEVDAPRVKVGLFPGSFPGPTIVTQAPDGDNTVITTTNDTPTITKAWGGLVNRISSLPVIALDAVYDKVLPGSWVAVDRPVLNPGANEPDRKVTFHRVLKNQTISMSMTGYRTRVTQLRLDPPWLDDLLTGSVDPIQAALNSSVVLNGTQVYAQAEPLELAEEPLDVDVEGETIELASLYDGLEAGRWIIVSGERTDIPNVTGVTASELVMISAVVQGSQAPLCVTFPTGLVPFSSVSYTTAANSAGDKLVVGLLPSGALETLKSQFARPQIVNQRFCEEVELGTGVYASAYVPTEDEWNLNFPQFDGLLVDPQTGQPYPGGKIPASKAPESQVFAWRISTDPVHTILKLANSLSYSYDATTVNVYANVAKATHGQTQGEVLGDGDGSQVLQTFSLHQSPLTYLPAPTPAGAASTLQVRVNDVGWEEADNISLLGPNDHSYVTGEDDNAITSITFGTGDRGARLPTGTANVKATYRSGLGKPGNVKAQQISQLATQPLGAKSVINPLAASGGADADSRDQARRNAPLAVMALDRLVSVSDYADFARTFAGIGKASSARLSDGRQLVVHVTIAGAGDIPIDQNSDLYRNLVSALMLSGDPYQPIQVAIRRLKLLVISAGVKVQAAYSWDDVAPLIRAALLDAYCFDRRDLGQAAFQSEAIAVIQAVGGVEYVDMRIFDAVPEGITAEQLAGLAGSLTLHDFVEADLAQIDLMATDVSKRILPAELVFLAPDIADTLLLTEIT